MNKLGIETRNTELPNAQLIERLNDRIVAADGALPFDEFMAIALYEPGFGYYSGGLKKLGKMPNDGSDFVTAPEMSSLFGKVFSVQIAQALTETNTNEIWEFGAGSGALAEQVLDALDSQGVTINGYHIVDLSADLQIRQRERLIKHADKITWHNELPEQIEGVVIGNEVLDAMPVKLLVCKDGIWYERLVTKDDSLSEAFIYRDEKTHLRPPIDDLMHLGLSNMNSKYLTEIHLQAEAFIHTLASKLRRGAAFFVDYGFPEREYYHPQRHMGTLMCHALHKSDVMPLEQIGSKDITAHVNFTGIALAGQNAGLEILGYTSQANFLINCGIAKEMEQSSLKQRVEAQRLIAEHEMGELFKVIGFATIPESFEAIGFSNGDRSHTL